MIVFSSSLAHVYKQKDNIANGLLTSVFERLISLLRHFLFIFFFGQFYPRYCMIHCSEFLLKTGKLKGEKTSSSHPTGTIFLLSTRSPEFLTAIKLVDIT